MRWIFRLFALIGVGLLAGGIYATHRTRQFLSRSETATGVVVENIWKYSRDRMSDTAGVYYPRIRFRSRAGSEYDVLSTSGSYPASYRPNDAVEVIYDPADPNTASINTFGSVWLGPIILFGLGIAFSGAGFGPLAWMRRRRQFNEWVRANGQRIETAFDRVELDTSVTMNGSHPYRIVSQWLNPATNSVHVFKSESIWYDPAQYIPGRTVAVWIDPANLKRYHMDTDFLPRAAG